MWPVSSLFPRQGSNTYPLHWEHRILTTRLSGKSLIFYFEANFVCTFWFVAMSLLCCLLGLLFFRHTAMGYWLPVQVLVSVVSDSLWPQGL